MLKNRKEIECYEEVMGPRPTYPKIWWYNLSLRYKQKAVEYFHRIEARIRNEWINEELVSVNLSDKLIMLSRTSYGKVSNNKWFSFANY